MADNEVIIDITARLDKAEAALKQFENDAKNSGDSAGTGYSSALTGAAVVGFQLLVQAAEKAFQAIVGFTEKAITAAIAQEDALNNLNNALARSGQFSAAASSDFEAYAEQLQKTTTYSRTAIEASASLIESIGHLSEGGLKTATTAATNLASALNIDLESASRLVGKAAEGNVETFRRYGIVIQAGSNNTETFANALIKLNNLQGAATAQANTFGGRIEQLKNGFNDLLISIGDIVIKSPELSAILKLIVDGVGEATAAISGFAKTGGLRNIILGIIDFGEAVNTYLVAPLELGYNIARIAIDGIALLIQGAVKTVVGAVSGVFDIIGLVTNKVDGIKDTLDILSDSTDDAFKDIANKTSEDTGKIFEFNAAAAGQGFIDKLRSTVEKAPPIKIPTPVNQTNIDPFQGITFTRIVNSFKMTTDQMNALAKSTVTTIRTTFVSGFGSAFQAIGAALVTGGNVFQAFGKAILGMFGDIAIQLGQFYLTLGLANLFLNPAAAAGQLAGGAALLILGGALKALAGGGSSASSSTGAASADSATSAASAPVGTSTSSLQSTTSATPNTGVVVNIQGSVMDSRETGLRIVDILNESFANNGTLLASGGTA